VRAGERNRHDDVGSRLDGRLVRNHSKTLAPVELPGAESLARGGENGAVTVDAQQPGSSHVVVPVRKHRGVTGGRHFVVGQRRPPQAVEDLGQPRVGRAADQKHGPPCHRRAEAWHAASRHCGHPTAELASPPHPMSARSLQNGPRPAQVGMTMRMV
jgi:hypothetical protein